MEGDWKGKDGNELISRKGRRWSLDEWLLRLEVECRSKAQWWWKIVEMSSDMWISDEVERDESWIASIWKTRAQFSTFHLWGSDSFLWLCCTRLIFLRLISDLSCLNKSGSRPSLTLFCAIGNPNLEVTMLHLASSAAPSLSLSLWTHICIQFYCSQFYSPACDSSVDLIRVQLAAFE